ncbi:MAG: DinB family protein [Lentimicrobiaceae bacterium]|jgi:uncharacterized damage-inducible protein DinB
MNEFERFKSIYAQQTMHTLDFLNMLSQEQWQAIPHNSDALFLGTRVNKITVSALVKHLIITGRHWINSVNSLPVGSTIPIPGNTALLDKVPDGTELMESYRIALEDNKQLLSGLTDGNLEKELIFAGRHYTGMGILWAMFGHHAYHLGQLDLLMRQMNITAPEYMEWSETKKVIA